MGQGAMSSPVISVVIVSDYAAGEEKSWDDFRQCLDGLARQDFAEPAEFLLCEWEGFRNAVPPDLAPRLPSVQLVFEPGRTAYELKNAGVRRARAPIVAVVDADCVPMAGWLRAALEAFRAHPDVAAVSGRTMYRGRSRLERILALITRSLPTDGEAAGTQRIAANNVAYSRQVYLQHPLSLEAGTWGSRLQNEAILRSGGKLYFEPRMQVAHDHTGWSMELSVAVLGRQFARVRTTWWGDVGVGDRGLAAARGKRQGELTCMVGGHQRHSLRGRGFQ